MDVWSLRPQRPDSQTLSALVAITTSRFPQEAPDLCIDPLTFTYHGSPHFLPGPTFTTGCIGEFVLEALSCKQRRLGRVVSRCSRYFAARMSAGAA